MSTKRLKFFFKNVDKSLFQSNFPMTQIKNKKQQLKIGYNIVNILGVNRYKKSTDMIRIINKQLTSFKHKQRT